MSAGVFNSGRKWLNDKALKNLYGSTTLSLGLYNNARESLTHRNVIGDIVPVSGPDYEPIAITADEWGVLIVLAADPLDDVVTLTIPDHFFTATEGEWSTVRGAYLFDATNSIAIAWRDAPIDYSMPTAAKVLVDWFSEVSAG